MANFARAVFLAALAAAGLAAAIGRWWAAAGCAVVAFAALLAFVKTTREGLIPLARIFRGVCLTKAGWGASGLAVFIVISAVQSGANLLFFLASATFAGVAVSVLYSVFALRRTSIEISLPAWSFAGEAATATAFCRNGKRIIPVVALHINGRAEPAGTVRAAVPRLPAGASARVDFEFTPARRGVVRAADVELSTIGPFGLARRRRNVSVPVEATVYPSVASVPVPPIARRQGNRGRSFASREGDFAGLRDWRPGDSLRHIHWRSSARVGRLVAKEFVVADRPQMMIVLDTFGEEGDAFEAAVSRAAAIAVAAARASYRVRLAWFDTAVRTVEDDPAGTLPHRILRILAEVAPQRLCEFAELRRRAAVSDHGSVTVHEVRIGAAAPEPAAPAGREAANV